MKFIELTQGKRAKVDDEDYEWLSKFNWWAERHHKIRWYAMTAYYFNGGHCNMAMHRIIMGVKDKHSLVFHEDCDTLNNQKRNLRIENKLLAK